jgi:hypothetical protein
MLSAFGVFWIGEGLGVPWPGEDVAIVAFAALFLLVAYRGRARAPPRRGSFIVFNPGSGFSLDHLVGAREQYRWTTLLKWIGDSLPVEDGLNAPFGDIDAAEGVEVCGLWGREEPKGISGYIPKADGQQRPLAIAALEDKIVRKGGISIGDYHE